MFFPCSVLLLHQISNFMDIQNISFHARIPRKNGSKEMEWELIMTYAMRYGVNSNPVNNTWTFGPPLNIGRSGAKAIVYHDKIYVIGGDDGNQRLKTVEVFDGNTWILLESKMNLWRSNFAVTILVMGGTTVIGGPQEYEVYNDVHDIWTKIKAMNFDRRAFTAVTMNHYLLSMKHFQS